MTWKGNICALIRIGIDKNKKFIFGLLSQPIAAYLDSKLKPSVTFIYYKPSSHTLNLLRQKRYTNKEKNNECQSNLKSIAKINC